MIGAVVVTYSAPSSTVATCLASVRDAGGIEACVLVDTGGSAVVPEALADVVSLVRMPNRGYGAAVNAGWRWLRERGATVVLVLNDDVTVRPGAVGPLLDALGGPIGVAQPVLLRAGAGEVASLGVEFDRHGAGVDLGRGAVPPVAGPPEPLEVFTGGAFAATVEFLDATDGFDERWFLYYEDADLALRGRALGWEYRLVTASVVDHVGGVSTSAVAERTLRLQERNRLWFAARHLPARTIGSALWLSVRRLRHRPRWTHLRALVAGLLGMPRRLVERRRSPSRGGTLA